MSVTSVTDTSFETEVLKASGIVLVDFWAEWCSPCRVMAPLFEEISTELEGKIKLVKVNIGKCPELVQQFAIKSVPTLMLFSGGKVIATKTGASSKQQLVNWISEFETV